ncbi:MAG: adenosine deaminase family protein [Rubrivivax sp.]|nr:adenosine deaminase family protein [Rubrivivax sp.]
MTDPMTKLVTEHMPEPVTEPVTKLKNVPMPLPMNIHDTHLAAARALPKVLLHEHLDGGLRVPTLLALLQQRGLAAPAPDAASLAAWFDANAHAGSLEKYLEGFALTVAAMATPEAMRRVALEAAQDAFEEGAVLAEFRIAPLLFEPHGVSGEAAVEALLQGLADAPMPCGLIICGMRHEPPERTERAARLALRFQGQGVVGYDLAGAEFGFPAALHSRALGLVRDAGLGLTLHAGEADAAVRVLQAARLGAKRIGHGVRLVDALTDPEQAALIDEARALNLHLEVCPTSNVHTGAAASIATHPITALWQAGVSLSYHTDNRLMSCITLDGEAAALLRHTPLRAADLLAMARQAALHSFLPAAAKAAATAAIDRYVTGASADTAPAASR